MAVCNGLIREGPSLTEKLSLLDEHISNIMDNLKEALEEDQQDNAETDWIKISEKNKQRIRSTLKTMKETVEIVKKEKGAIQSTLTETVPPEDEAPTLQNNI